MFHRPSRISAFIVLVAVAAGLSPVVAGRLSAQGQSSANMVVTATVIPKCIVTTAPLNFGVYDAMMAHATAPLDAQSTITVACTRGTAVTIGIDDGAYNRVNTRRMYDNNAHYIEYELYKDQSRTQRWGERFGERYDAGIAPSRDPRQFIVYGRVPPGQDVDTGGYTDSVVVTVHF